MHVINSAYAMLFVSILSIGTSFTATAQTLAELPTGSRVSIAVDDSLRNGLVQPGRQSVVGRLVRTTADSITLSLVGSRDVSIARSAIRRVDVSRGISRKNSGIAMGLGFVLIGVGVALHENHGQPYHRTQNILVVGGVGFGVGTLLGALYPYERWRRVRH